MPFDSFNEEISPAAPPKIAGRYLFLTEALLAQSRLDSAEIDTFLIDETVARMDWFWLNGLGGVRIMVPGDEADDAALILAAPLLPQFETEQGEFIPQPTCPRCNSLDIAYHPATQSNILVSVLINPIAWLLLFFARDRWRCFSCGYSWHDQQYEGFPEPPPATVTPIS
jgi:hypothetical protein